MDTWFPMSLGLLAQGGPNGEAGGDQAAIFRLVALVVSIGFLFYFFMIRPQRREQASRQAMLAAVKKNDRVVTIGGIYGVVTNVQHEADEVTIKVDEATNTKLRVTLGSIARVTSDSAASDKD